MTKRYVQSKMPKSDCPHCGGQVIWIKPKPVKDPLLIEFGSIFICWKCEWIGQVGFGVVEDE